MRATVPRGHGRAVAGMARSYGKRACRSAPCARRCRGHGRAVPGMARSYSKISSKKSSIACQERRAARAL
jgi:hypothetical protein